MSDLTSRLDALVLQLADEWDAGNRSKVLNKLAWESGQREAAYLAVGIFETLRGRRVGGIHDANAFRAAILTEPTS